MATPTTRTRRIDVRVTEAQDSTIREAAALAGETVTSFLLTAAEDRARELLDERRHLTMSNAAFSALTKALDEPGAAVPELVELFDLAPLSQT
ncbi:MAG: DUF1778 domain-containing protein [Microthrixaceae bacterium]|jgi:uncharacterized protein (DUF1778 family)|nr:DUF1778 domain-containing protein [Microthrixaceae bacterium]